MMNCTACTLPTTVSALIQTEPLMRENTDSYYFPPITPQRVRIFFKSKEEYKGGFRVLVPNFPNAVVC